MRKTEITTQFYLMKNDKPDASGQGFQYDVIRDISEVRFNARGLPVITTHHDTTACFDLAHGLAEWWAQINRHQRDHYAEHCTVIDISPDYTVTLFHTQES